MIFTLFIGWLALTMMGIGLAYLICGRNMSSGLLPLAIAPSVGLCLLGLVLFPLCRIFGPISKWATIATVLIIAMNLLILWRGKFIFLIFQEGKHSALIYAGVLACGLYWGIAFNSVGISRTAFTNNPSDAFTYMTLAETFRTADWETIVRAVHPKKPEDRKKLVALSTSAMYSARFVLRPLRLGTMHGIAWLAELGQISVYRAYKIWGILCLMIAVPLVFVFFNHDELRPIFVWMLSGVLFLGYWIRMLFEYDCLSQLNFVPLVLTLLVALQLIFSKERNNALSGTIFGSLVLANAVVFYTEFVPYLITCLLLCLLLGTVFDRSHPLRIIKTHGIMLIGAVGILFLSGQLGFYVDCFEKQYEVSKQKNIGGPALLEPYLTHHPLVAFWGLADFDSKGKDQAHQTAIKGYGIIGTGWICTTIAFLGILDARKRLKSNTLLVITGFLLGTVIVVGVIYFKTHEVYLLGKTLFYLYHPLAIIFLMLGFQRVCSWQMRVTSLRHIFPIVGYMAMGGVTLLPVITGFPMAIKMGSPNQMELTMAKLSKIMPQNLIVSLEPTTPWPLMLHSVFLLEKYKPYLIAGVPYDNRDGVLLPNLQTFPQHADYFLANHDTFPPSDLQTLKVWQDGKWCLYKLIGSSQG
jgi:hypothetical protein